MSFEEKRIDLQRRCERHGIVWDCGVRWEQGIDHHPEAKKIFEMIAEGDFYFTDDYFCWRSGGDGDNGEALMFGLSVILELRDAENDEARS